MFTLNVLPSCTIRDMKVAIRENDGIPVDEQRLYVVGASRQLVDSRSLEYYKIQDMTTLHLKLPSHR